MLAAAALSGCAKQLNDGPEAADGRIDLLTGIEPLTRSPQLDGSGAGNFSAGDTFTLSVSDGSQRVQKSYTVGTTVLYWQDLGLTGGTAAFTGCYPNLGTDGGTTFRFDASEAPDADLLLAPAVTVARGAAKVQLPFRHAMHKLAVRYTSDGTYTAEELKGIVTVPHAHTVCTVDLSAGKVTDGSASSPEDLRAVTGAEASWLIVPQGREAVKLKVSFGGRTQEFTLPEQTEEGRPVTTLDGGKTLTVKLRAAKDGISFEGMAIGPWEDQGSVNGDIIL